MSKVEELLLHPTIVTALYLWFLGVVVWTDTGMISSLDIVLEL